MDGARQQTHIAHVRVQGAGLDPLLTPLRVGLLLNSVEMRPSSLPPSAILCVRQLRDPMPGTLRLNGYASRLPQRWEQALRASLNDCARHAVRPLHQVVPANAEAVIFEDRAEMLACLALDWMNGMLTHRWWWRNLLHDYDLSRTVFSLWLDKPQDVPVALAYLAARGEVVRIVGRMDETMVSTLMKRILEVFNLRALATTIQESLAGAMPSLPAPALPMSSAGEWTNEVSHAKSGETPAGFAMLTTASTFNFETWADRVPESHNESLTLTRQLLLGIALSLVRDAARVRTASFALETRRWLQNEVIGIAEIPPAPPERLAPVMEIVWQKETPREPDAIIPQIAADKQATTETAQPDQTSLTENDVTSGDRSAEESTMQMTRPDFSAEPGILIETAFGGLFYLLNLALHLGFYSDFTTSWKQEIELSIWDFITLIGRELVGGERSDPIWALLAQLARRDADTPPGASFVPASSWRIDPRWLDAFPERDLFGWSVHDERLRVIHPVGFLLVDIPLEGDLLPLFEEVSTTYGVDLAISETNDFSTSNDGALRRWLDWLMPYVRARLQRALGLDSTDDLASLLCQHDARIFVTPTQVDVLLNLDTLPIEIRLAGLDRNPGWLPAAGRTITFHFEPGGG